MPANAGRRAVVGGIQRLEDGESIDYSEDFFGRPAFLTVRMFCCFAPDRALLCSTGMTISNAQPACRITSYSNLQDLTAALVIISEVGGCGNAGKNLCFCQPCRSQDS